MGEAWTSVTTTVEEALLSVEETASRLRLDDGVVKALAEAGILPAVRVGSRWRIPPEGLAEFRLRICRGEVPSDITPVNGVIAHGGKSGASRTRNAPKSVRLTGSDGEFRDRRAG